MDSVYACHHPKRSNPLLAHRPACAEASADKRAHRQRLRHRSPLARLTGTWLLNSAQQTLNYHGYEHNLRNDITRHTRTDASFVDYDYDDLGQLTDAVGSGSSGSPVRSRRRFGVRRWSASGFAAFRAGGEVVRWMNVCPAVESGGGLTPTTALQDAGARFGKPRGKTASLGNRMD
ncbi:MAG TPA: hypothetical protein VMS21_05750 [Methylomirabilota bacterium]|nr:hypothetical protein [Methylomirabilota bacterium]